MRRSIAPTLALAAAIGFGPGSLHAQVYRWVDEAGGSHYSEGLDTVPERYRPHAAPLRFRNKPAAPEPESATRTPAGAATIRYAPGQRMITDARLNATASVRLILDTGADRTLISPRALAAAGVSLSRTVAIGKIVGVTGTDRLPYVMIESLEVGGARVGPMPVGAYAMADADVDGLLGRDVLDRFNIAIDAVQGLVTLSPK